MPNNDFIPRFEAALIRAAAINPNPLPDTPPVAKPIVPLIDEAESSISNDRGQDLMVLLLGASVSMVVAVVVYFLVNLTGFPFHAQTVWFVFPIFAFICGLAAGGGFWLALRKLDRLPGVGTYLGAGIAGVLSYILIYFLMWWLLEFQGVRVRSEFGFGEFMQYVLEHQRVRFGRGDRAGVAVGNWGYLRFAINLAGFVGGVIWMVSFAGRKAYCPRCKRYLQTVGKQLRSSSDPEALAVALHPVIFGIFSGRIQEALDLHAEFGAEGYKEYLTTTITIEACPGCRMHLTTMKASIFGMRGPEEIKGFLFQGVTDHPVQLST